MLLELLIVMIIVALIYVAWPKKDTKIIENGEIKKRKLKIVPRERSWNAWLAPSRIGTYVIPRSAKGRKFIIKDKWLTNKKIPAEVIDTGKTLIVKLKR